MIGDSVTIEDRDGDEDGDGDGERYGYGFEVKVEDVGCGERRLYHYLQRGEG